MKQVYRTGLWLVVALGLMLSSVAQVRTFADKRHPQPNANTPGLLTQPIPVPTQFSPAPIQPLAGFPTKAWQKGDLIDVKFAPNTGLPIYIRAVQPIQSFTAGHQETVIRQAATTFLDQVSDLMRINGSQDFVQGDMTTDKEGFAHMRLQQTHLGVPVYGGEVTLHFTPTAEIIMTGRHQASPALTDVTPDVTVENAIQTAQTDLGHIQNIRPFGDFWKKLLDYENGPQTELVIFQTDEYVQRHRLTYHITLRPNVYSYWEYFVDAETGDVLHKYDHTCTVVPPSTGSGTDLNGQTRNLATFNDGGTHFLIDAAETIMYQNPPNRPDLGDGIIVTFDMRNDPAENAPIFFVTSNNPNNWDATAVSAHYNSEAAFDYFENTHSRNSINGQGGDVISLINVPDENGNSLENAYWNGKAMFYGNGGSAFGPLAASLDVGGHEMSHGVVQETANLEYQDQPGALNESFADIFGVLVEYRTTGVLDWYLGEDVTKTNYIATGRLRDMSDPHNGGNSLNDNGWQPRHMDEIYTGTGDNGGVHINSGIVNFAFYKFATNADVGADKAERVFYRALSTYLTRFSEFIDCRIAVIQSANDLFPSDPKIAAAAGKAYDEVGILDPNNGGQTPRDPSQNVPGNNGQTYIVFAEPSTSFSFDQWYIAETPITSSTTATPISQEEPRTRMSMSDDGSIGVFVGDDHHIYLLANPTDPNNLNEIQLSANPTWNSAAISKDGNLLAAITDDQDGEISVFDLRTSPIQGWTFTLYNPTTGNGGVNTGGVLYADAISFDFCGEYLLYDALNRVGDGMGNDVEYWDVGLLRVWDIVNDQVGDGFITKLFTNLPEGVSVGNADYSKNSPFILTMDYFDETDNTYEVLAANIVTGDVTTIWQNLILGYPSFTATDNGILFNGESTGGDEIVAQQGVASDKITPSGNPFVLLSPYRWATEFTLGNRGSTCLTVNNDPVVEQLAGKLTAYPNPAMERLTLEATAPTTGQASWQVFDLMGRVVFTTTQQAAKGQTLSQEISLQAWTAGSYLVRLTIGDQSMTEKVIVR